VPFFPPKKKSFAELLHTQYFLVASGVKFHHPKSKLKIKIKIK